MLRKNKIINLLTLKKSDIEDQLKILRENSDVKWKGVESLMEQKGPYFSIFDWSTLKLILMIPRSIFHWTLILAEGIWSHLNKKPLLIYR